VEDLPDGMKLFGETGARCPILDEVFHLLRLFECAAFEAAGVVKDETGVAFEYHLILNIVLPALEIIR
jgi:hypothetical protein